MRMMLLSVAALVALLSSCSSIDDYEYGYAPAYRTLPEGFEQVEVGGTPYWHHGGRFYMHDPERGYLLVKPPRGSEQVVAAAGAGAGAAGAASPSPSASPVAAAPQQAGSSENPIARIFRPGGGVLEKRGRARQIGNSPIRRSVGSTAE